MREVTKSREYELNSFKAEQLVPPIAILIASLLITLLSFRIDAFISSEFGGAGRVFASGHSVSDRSPERQQQQ